MAGASAIRAPRFGLAAKIFLASASVVVAVLLATFGVTSMQANRTADASIERALTNTRRAVEDFLTARTAALAAVSTAGAEVPQFRERVLSGVAADVGDQAQDYRDLLSAAWVLVTDAEGVLLHRTDYPDEVGDTLGGALIGQALEGEQTSGAFIDDRDPAATRLYLAVATPLGARGAAPQGVLVSAYALDDSLAHAISQATNADVVFFALDTANVPVVVAGTLVTGTIGPALREPGFVAALAADSAGTALAADMGSDHLIGRAGAIRSAGGTPLGGFLALRSRAAELGAFRALQRTMILAIAFGVVLALASAFLLARQIAGPVRQLVLATRRVQDGDYSVNIDVKSRDEIGLLSQAFQGLVEDLKEKADLVEYMVAASAAAGTQPIDALPSGRRTVAAEMEAGGRALKPGTVFAGRYEVKEILGMGGMGVVYRAFDRELGEPVAIKTLRPEALAADDRVALERFKQEIRLARKIAHRNVVRTYDLGEANGMYYLTMEFVEGTSLKQLIEGRGKLPVPVTLTIGKQLCRALEVAHEQGVIHRDIKPQNMVVDPSGFLKVMDFGIARLAQRQGHGLTEKGTSVGTPDYMSPEQLTGDEIDARADLYAAGVVLFECVTGRMPFVGETTWALIAKHIEEPAPDPRTMTPEVPPALSGVILKAMAKKPDERFRSAGAMHDALAAIG